jgi:transaldolase
MEGAMTENNLYKLTDLGQSVWFDDINREAIASGKLARLIEQYNVTGGTSNPTIFEKAFSGTNAYDEQFRNLAREDLTPEQIQDTLALTDVQMAADQFAEVFRRTDGKDGYVSLEVAPSYAHDTEATLSETRRLFAALDRPNTMIKIPGTPEGVPAIEQSLFGGINVNITLLFSVESYEAVLEAYVYAMEKRLASKKPVSGIASVASFFISRVDTMADERLEKLAEQAQGAGKERILGLRGKLGLANAKLAYEKYLEMTASDRWKRLEAEGAAVQRCLWASTSTKNPDFSDTMYVDNLIGPDTVNTLPEDTLHAFAERGTAANTLTDGIGEAKKLIEELKAVGLDLDALSTDLQREGVEKFAKSYDDAIAAIKERSREAGVR